MTPVHVISLPEKSGRDTPTDKLCHLTAILRMRDTREEAEANTNPGTITIPNVLVQPRMKAA